MNKLKYFILLFIFLLNIGNIYAFDTSKKVYDYAQVLTLKEENKLRNEIDLFIANYNIDIALITVKHHGKENTNSYINEFYNINGFGIGQNKDAIFCVIDFSMEKEKVEISVFGNEKNILDINDIKNIKNKLNSKLDKQEYYKTLDLFLTISNKEIKKNILNSNTSKDYNIIKIVKIFCISIIFTLIIGGLLLLQNKNNKYKKIIKDYIDSNSFTINKIQEKLITTKTTTHKQEEKMNKKGFTLIELLAVIVVLSVIMLITAMSVNKVLDNADNKLSKTQLKNIESAAKMYYLEEGMDVSDTYGCVSVNDLIKKGYIEQDEVLDPKTDEKVLGSVRITYKNNKYKYTYQDKACFISNGTPVYFDVARGTSCTKEEYEESFDETENDYLNSKTGYNGIYVTDEKQNSCLKFYAFNDDKPDTINLILDHNISTNVAWNSVSNTNGPKEVMDKLKEDTKNWNGTNQPNPYSFKYNYLTNHYTLDGIDYTIDYEGYKARLITAEEVAKITGADELINWKIDVNVNGFYLDGKNGDDPTWETQISDSGNKSEYYWLFDRTDGCIEYGCKIEDSNSNYAYWTASTSLYIAGGVFGINRHGELYTEGNDDNFGVRPVIEVSKNKLIKEQEKVNTIDDICTLESGDALKAGSKYKCKVDPNKEPYTFYVLTTPNSKDSHVNLIMDQNINSDGTPAGRTGVTKDGENVYNLVAWQSSSNSNTVGPVDAMQFLYNATKVWTNIEPLNFTYKDREYQNIPADDIEVGYTSFISKNGKATITPLSGNITSIGTDEEPLRTRMIVYSVFDLDGNRNKGEVDDDSASYLYYNCTCEDNSWGYWTLSATFNSPGFAGTMYCAGYVNDDTIYEADYGVRPVISIKIKN